MDVTDSIKALDAALGLIGRLSDLVGRIGTIFGGSRDAVREIEQTVQTLKDQLLAARQDLMAAKEATLVLREENLRLREKTKELEDRLRQQEELVLHSVGPGAVFYVVKGVDGAAESAIRYCQACADAGQKAVLQFAERKFHFDRHECPRCKSSIQLPNDNRMEAFVVPIRNRYDDFIG